MSRFDLEGVPVAPLSMRNIETITEDYLRKYHKGNLDRPSALDADTFLTVSLQQSHSFMLDIVAALDNPSIEAQTLMLERRIQISHTCFNNLGADEGRARFTVCHEGMHVILHSEQYQALALNPARLRKRNRGTCANAEWQAEHGAGALLMPMNTLVPFICLLEKQGCADFSILQDIADVYKVSFSAAQARVRQILKPGLRGLTEYYKKTT
jgi:hypothetical protein